MAFSHTSGRRTAQRNPSFHPETIQKILITIWTFIKKYSLIIYAKVRQLIEEYKQKKNIKKDGQ